MSRIGVTASLAGFVLGLAIGCGPSNPPAANGGSDPAPKATDAVPPIGEAATAKEKVAWKPETADLLFSSDRDGNHEIYLLRAGQKEWVNLSNNKAFDFSPVWSPDGKWIAFSSDRGRKHDIWKMKADGTEAVQLTKNAEESNGSPSWSPDGKTILYNSMRKEQGDKENELYIYAMNSDGSNQRRLVKQSIGNAGGAAWSADGKLIAYPRNNGTGGRRDIFVADSDGTNERRITDDEGNKVSNDSPSFSPDGKSIAYTPSSGDGKSTALTLIDIDGKNRRTLISEGENYRPQWSPDGNWLVFMAMVPSEDKKVRSNSDIFAVEVAGTAKPILLVGGPKWERFGSWCPTRSASSSMSQPTEQSKPPQPAPAGDKSNNATLIVGKWEITKTTFGFPPVPVGSKYGFTKDGKMTFVVPQVLDLGGTYKVDKDKLTYRLELENFDSVFTIKLTDDILEIQYEDKNTLTFKRIK